MSSPPVIAASAPAKVNLGLEVLGRRADGFHDIATIFTTVSLYDHLLLRAGEERKLVCEDLALDEDDNLIVRALKLLEAEAGIPTRATVELTKGIPAASGLGGPSSDVAATLLAARDHWRLALPDETLAAIGARLGSDVPFFLRGGGALGQGRGEILEPLCIPGDARFVIVVPDVTIPRKTATQFGRLRPDDFSDGARVMAQAARLRAGLPLDPALLGNAFSRPLYALVPALAELPAAMLAAGAPVVALSGAGPAHYTIVDDPGEAKTIGERLAARLGNDARVFVVGPTPARYDGR